VLPNLSRERTGAPTRLDLSFSLRRRETTPPLLFLSYSILHYPLTHISTTLYYYYYYREVWYRYIAKPGTMRAVVARLFQALLDRQWPTDWSSLLLSSPSLNSTIDSNNNNQQKQDNNEEEDDDWYVTRKDLAVFKAACESDATTSQWEKMCHKEFPGITYTAWRRWLPNINKTEYKSVTISEDSTATEYMDFYLDDSARPSWDTMISEYELLENKTEEDITTTKRSTRQQVVRWLRSFPFAFINQREYVIARRIFHPSTDDDNDDTVYGITKGIDHPLAARKEGVVRMDTFYSMWRSRTVPCPKGSGKPACETILLHFEDFGIPENLARFAVKHGMVGFVKKMGGGVKKFVEERREVRGVRAHDQDPQAYGMNAVTADMFGNQQQMKMEKKIDAGGSSDGEEGTTTATATAMKRSPSMKNLGYVMLAGGVALALSTITTTTTSTSATPGSKSITGHVARQHAKQQHHRHNNRRNKVHVPPPPHHHTMMMKTPPHTTTTTNKKKVMVKSHSLSDDGLE